MCVCVCVSVRVMYNLIKCVGVCFDTVNRFTVCVRRSVCVCVSVCQAGYTVQTFKIIIYITFGLTRLYCFFTYT